MNGLFDAHCHLDFAENGVALAAAAERAGVAAFSATVTPSGYERARRLFEPFPNVRAGLGLHPWWVADGSCGEAEIERFEELASAERFIGEIGLDFAPYREETRTLQAKAFERAVRAAFSGMSGKVATFHAVRAADEVLDVLERAGCTADNACVMHWFSGSNDALLRAARMGCYFSVNPRMLGTKRGRAYARALPVDRLLVETDWPSAPSGIMDFSEWGGLLCRTVEELERLRGEELKECLAATAKELFFRADRA